MTKIKTYSELIRMADFNERLKYLKTESQVGIETFGVYRYINQRFYNSTIWKQLRNSIIVRDNGCDLACKDYPIYHKILIHHLNPVSIEDFYDNSKKLTDPENLVCVSPETHNLIHYNHEAALKIGLVERRPGDTCPWK